MNGTTKLCNKKSKWIRLNVGGTYFCTTTDTLSKYPDTFLHKLCHSENNMSSDKDETGAFLIDREPSYFAPILNFMRHGKLVYDKNVSEEGILEEAEFYNIEELVSTIKTKIQERDEVPVAAKSIKNVFRVIHSTEEELTNTISSIADGWKFEQLISVSSPYPYSSADMAEYLCIVSKEVGNTSLANHLERSSSAKVLQI